MFGLRQQLGARGLGLGAHLRVRLVDRLLRRGARLVGHLALVRGGLGADLAALFVRAVARDGELLLVVGELGVGLRGHPLGLRARAFDAGLAALAQLQVRLEQQLVRDDEQDQEQHELNDDRAVDVDQRVACGERRAKS